MVRRLWQTEMHEIEMVEVVPRSCAHCIASGSQRGEEGLVRKKGEAKLPDYKSLQTDYGPLATSPPPPLECKISACFVVVTLSMANSYYCPH